MRSFLLLPGVYSDIAPSSLEGIPLPTPRESSSNNGLVQYGSLIFYTQLWKRERGAIAYPREKLP